MNDIEQQSESGEEKDRRTPPRRKQLRMVVAGFMIVPFMLLSLMGLSMLDLVPSRGVGIVVCILQIVMLAIAWYAIMKASRWQEILAVAVIAVGLYLFLLGICSGKFS